MKSEILRISKKLGLSHIGSNMSVFPILQEIYKKKKPKDIVILDNGHAHLSHLVVKKLNAEKLIEKYGIHCDRKAGCDASGGSLGHGLGIAIGYALAGFKVHVVVSDGSMQEGSNWEALRIIDSLGLNIQIYANFNGFSAVAPVDFYTLKTRMSTFVKGIKFYQTENGLSKNKVDDHYVKL